MAERHPVGFPWVMEAKERGAKIIHVDPRFTRTSAMADLYAPIRAGADVAFLGGLVNVVLNDARWNGDPFFHEYLVNYTNAATLVGDEFQDTDDLDGVFSGLMEYKGGVAEWPFNGFVGQYNNKSWQYAGSGKGQSQGWTGNTQQSGETPAAGGSSGGPSAGAVAESAE